MTINIFRAGANGITGQTGISYGPTQGYTQVQATTTFKFAGVSGFDTGGEWNNVTWQWKPQAGPIDWQYQAWVGNFGDPSGQNFNLCATVFKNGVDFLAGIGGAPFNTFPTWANAMCCGSDLASGTDVYDFRVYMTTYNGAASGFLNADPRHIWICGKSFGQ